MRTGRGDSPRIYVMVKVGNEKRDALIVIWRSEKHNRGGDAQSSLTQNMYLFGGLA